MPNLCENLFGFSPTVLGHQARRANLMEAGHAPVLNDARYTGPVAR
jgi:hypothetical protein